MSTWGSTWGFTWGATTEWNTRADPRDPASALLRTLPGDLDTIQTAIARLRRQFSSTVSWPALATILGKAFADFERAHRLAEPQRYVGAATGVWLAEIGALVGLSREGWTDDDDYRLAIVAEALSRITSGSIDEIVDVALRLTPDGATLFYSEQYPAAFDLAIADLPPGRFALILSVLSDMPPAGVGAFLTTWPTALVAGWAFDDLDPEVFGSWDYLVPGDADALSLWSYSASIG